MALSKLFTEHPRSVGETYLQHLSQALSFGIKMLVGGLACLVHALLPFMFERTGSRYISQLHDCMVANRSRAKRVSLDNSFSGS